ncbi:hypothetical protein CSKR_109012 [Clonorchis sinensis]|uniref:Uncharacterized protein n=1 Tax=Clonorchis sinensis TaxID=79923 RepID=A0A3R7GGN7_CLOSI|nr:hypothetical protein CSKR_109012 [Clonorchis sinensis]
MWCFQATECVAPGRFISYQKRKIQLGSRLTETWGLRLPDEPQEGRNRSWAVEEFSATLWVVHYE